MQFKVLVRFQREQYFRSTLNLNMHRQLVVSIITHQDQGRERVLLMCDLLQIYIGNSLGSPTDAQLNTRKHSDSNEVQSPKRAFTDRHKPISYPERAAIMNASNMENRRTNDNAPLKRRAATIHTVTRLKYTIITRTIANPISHLC